MKTYTPQEAKAKGFATFNDAPHHCIDVADGVSTISLRTSEGKLITVSLLPYNTGGPPQCADVVSHTHVNDKFAAQNIRVFNRGLTPYSHDPTDGGRYENVKANPPLVTSIILLPTS